MAKTADMDVHDPDSQTAVDATAEAKKNLAVINVPGEDVEDVKEHRNGVAESHGDQADVEPVRKRLWLVRMPKPAEAGAIKVVDVELQTYKAQMRLLTESLGVKKLQRDAARDELRAAREALRRCREAQEAKAAEVEPLREAARSGGAASRKLREEFGDLELRTEAELDAKLAAHKHRIEHETIPLGEEKALVAAIKKLSAQRPRVREYEAAAAAAAGSRDDSSRLRGELAEREAELKALRAERDAQAAVFTRLRDLEGGLDAEIEGVVAERRRVREAHDAAYERASADRRVNRSRSDEYYANRRFSKGVRDAVAARKLEEAAAMCRGQMDEAVARLAADVEFRREYFEQWALARAAAAAAAAAADEEADVPTGRDKGAACTKAAEHGGKQGGKAAQREDPVQTAAKAQAVITAVLENAEAAAAAPTPAAGGPAEPPGAGNGLVHAPAAPPAHKPVKKEKHAAKHVVAPVVEPPDNFELPEVVRQAAQAAEAGGGGAMDKAAERERNRAAQAEAEQRKQKRELEKARRREKAAAAALAGAMEHHEVQLKAKAGPPAGEVAAPTSDAAAEGAAEAEAEGEGAAAQAADEAARKPSSPKPAPRAPSKLPLSVAKAMAPRPAAKRPVTRSFARQLQAFVKGNEMILLAAALVAILAVVIALFSAPPQLAA